MSIKRQIERVHAAKRNLVETLRGRGIDIDSTCSVDSLPDIVQEIAPPNKMYVCTSVDKDNREWTGREAVLMGDDSYRYYVFSDQETTGLKYTSVNPAPNEGWDDKCCMRMNSIFQGISTNSLYFYGIWGNGGMPGIQYGHAALDINISSGICSASEKLNGVVCALYRNVTGVSQSKTGISGNTPITIATWYMDCGGATNTLILGLGAKSSNKGIFLCTHNGYAAYNLGGTTVSTGVLVNDKLHHMCLVYTGSAIGMYVDGELVYQTSASISITNSPFYFGGNISGSAGSISGFSNLHGYIKHTYAYARALSDFDVRALANEEWPIVQVPAFYVYIGQEWTTASDTVPISSGTTIFSSYTALAMFKYTKEDGTVYYSSFPENGDSESGNGIEIYEASDGRLLLDTVIYHSTAFDYLYPPTIDKNSLPRLTDITSPVPYMRDADINMIIIPAGYTTNKGNSITYSILPGLGVSVTIPLDMEDHLYGTYLMELSSVSAYPVVKEPGLVLEVVSGAIELRNIEGIIGYLDSSIGAIRLEKISSSTTNKYAYDGNNEMLNNILNDDNNIGTTSAEYLFIQAHPVSGKPTLYIDMIYDILCDSFDDLMAGYTHTKGSVTLQITPDSSL